MEIIGVDFRTIILAIAAVSNLILGTLIFLRSKLKSTVFFVLTVIGVGIWSIGINLYIQPGVTATTLFWSDINYLTAAIFSVAFFLFAYYLISKNKLISKKGKLILK